MITMRATESSLGCLLLLSVRSLVECLVLLSVRSSVECLVLSVGSSVECLLLLSVGSSVEDGLVVGTAREQKHTLSHVYNSLYNRNYNLTNKAIIYTSSIINYIAIEFEVYTHVCGNITPCVYVAIQINVIFHKRMLVIIR